MIRAKSLDRAYLAVLIMSGMIGIYHSVQQKFHSLNATRQLRLLRKRILAAVPLVYRKRVADQAKDALNMAEHIHDRVLSSLGCADSDSVVLNEMIDQSLELVDLATALATGNTTQNLAAEPDRSRRFCSRE